MKIRTKLSVNTGVSICLALLVAITLFFTSTQIRKALIENQWVDEIVAGINDLDRAIYVHALHQNDQTRWERQLKYNRLKELLSKARFNEKEEMAILDRISKNHEALGVLFDQLGKRKKGAPASYQRKGNQSEDSVASIIAQITAKRERMSNDASLLTRSNNAAILSAARVSFLFLAISVGLMVAFVSSTSLLMIRRITRSLLELEQWADKIAEGKLDHRVYIDGNDEGAKLGRTFNEMTGKLSASYAALEAEIAERRQVEKDLEKKTYDLKERLKELSCLYTISEFAGKNETEEEILNKIVEAIPSAWQYPEITCARITLGEKKFKTGNFKESPWKQVAGILSHGQEIGSVEIRYLEERKTADEGPFLKEERELLNTITKIVEEVIERKRVEQKAQEEYNFRKTIEDSILSGITVVDLEGRQIYVNPAFCKMVGWSQEELLGAKSPFVYWSSEEMQMIGRRLRQELSENQRSGSFELRFQRKTGERFDVLLLDSPLRDNRGKTIGRLASIGDITAHKRTENALKESEKQLKQLAAQLMTAQEEERKRIARELHDSIAASLAGIKFRIETVQNEIRKGTPAYQSLSALVLKIHQIIEEVRKIVANLWPSVLDQLGIKAGMDWLCREFEKTYSQIGVEKRVEIDEEEVPDSLKIVIFRILQEAMSNIAKHSAGNLVRLCLAKNENKLELSVEDNGVGFNPDEIFSAREAGRGLGLVSMRERTQLSGGSFGIESVKGKGTTIRSAWPLQINLGA